MNIWRGKMLGFTYICKLHDVEYLEIADILGIKKQTINCWISGARKIPKKHLPILAERFKTPEEYFQREIDTVGKIAILENHILVLNQEK